jgi:micrococcal nuclease
MYEYKALITKVYDGDTLTADIDLGFKLWAKKIKIRLAGVDTPEIRTKDPEEKVMAIKARDRVRELCLGKEVIITTRGKGKYGRWLASVYIDDGELDITRFLIAEGLAKEYSK